MFEVILNGGNKANFIVDKGNIGELQKVFFFNKVNQLPVKFEFNVDEGTTNLTSLKYPAGEEGFGPLQRTGCSNIKLFRYNLFAGIYIKKPPKAIAFPCMLTYSKEASAEADVALPFDGADVLGLGILVTKSNCQRRRHVLIYSPTHVRVKNRHLVVVPPVQKKS